jgi:hypothetical protein
MTPSGVEPASSNSSSNGGGSSSSSSIFCVFLDVEAHKYKSQLQRKHKNTNTTQDHKTRKEQVHKQDRQCTYNVNIVARSADIVVVEKQ